MWDVSLTVTAWFIVEKPAMTFSQNFWFSKGWFQADVVFKAERCILLTSNHSSPRNCCVSYRWLVGCAKREENGINVAKPCIHKAVGSGIKKYFQASVEHICCLLFFNQGSMSAVYHKYAILFLCTPKFILH